MATASRAALVAPALPIASVPTRHSRRHLHNREERVHSLEHLAFYRNSENRQNCLRCGHARKMRGAAGTGDDHFQSPAFSLGRILSKPQRRPMSGDNPAFVRHFKLREQLIGMPQRFPIRLAGP